MEDQIKYLKKYLKNKDMDTAILELKKGIPVQYIVGDVDFYKYNFIVNQNVLIPRFETEELVDNTIRYIKANFSGEVKIIDVGCGSGAIGITLAKELENAKVTCLDISDAVLDVTRENARRLNAPINVLKGDMLDYVNDKYDIVISNPPYIATDEEIEDIVKNNEPHLALYSGEDGMDSYRQIFSKIKNVINDKYLIALEIGCTQKDAVTAIIKKSLPDAVVTCTKDLSGRDRMIFVTNK